MSPLPPSRAPLGEATGGSALGSPRSSSAVFVAVSTACARVSRGWPRKSRTAPAAQFGELAGDSNAVDDAQETEEAAEVRELDAGACCEERQIETEVG